MDFANHWRGDVSYGGSSPNSERLARYRTPHSGCTWQPSTPLVHTSGYPVRATAEDGWILSPVSQRGAPWKMLHPTNGGVTWSVIPALSAAAQNVMRWDSMDFNTYVGWLISTPLQAPGPQLWQGSRPSPGHPMAKSWASGMTRFGCSAKYVNKRKNGGQGHKVASFPNPLQSKVQNHAGTPQDGKDQHSPP